MTSVPAAATALDLLPVMRALPGLYLFLSPEFTILEATDAYLAATLKDRSIIGRYLFEVYPDNPDAPETNGSLNLRQSLEYARTHKMPHRMEVQRYDVTRPAEQGGGFEEKYWQPLNTPVLDAAGEEVLYLIHQVEDVTQKHKLLNAQEQIAQENLERFELIAKATNDVIWDWNLLNDTIWWNDGFKTTFGYKEEDIEKDINSWYGRIHPDDAERVVQSIHAVIDHGGTHWQDEYSFRRADGTYADIFDRGIVARDETGKPVRMIGAMLDITEKNRYAADLKASEQQVKAILEGIPEIAWVAQADGYIYYYNKAWYQYTGNQSPDQGWGHILHPDDLDATVSRWAHALATGENYVNEARLRRAQDGQYRWFTMLATPLQDAAGNIQAWIGVDTDIQEQKDIQQNLRERDEYVQRMLAQAPVQFAVIKGEQWTVDFATPNFKLLVGGRDIVGKPYKEALPELQEQGIFDIMQQVYSTGRLYRGNEQPIYLDRNGSGTLELGYFDYIYQPLFSPDSQVEGVMILVVEVTERVLAKQETEKLTDALQSSYDRIKKILDALPHMTFTARPDGYIDYYSQRWYSFLGGSQKELIGWRWEDYVHPEDWEATIASWRRSLATGHDFAIENRWFSVEEGGYRWYLVRAVPVRDEEGHITMWVGSNTDIHDQKQMLLALQESTEHFRFLADSMPQLVWTTDPHGFHDYFNQRWVDYTGYDVEASKGTQMWNNLLHPEDQERAFARWRYSLETGEPYQVEYRFRRASDGEWRWFLGRALPMRDAEGNILRWFGTCTDIEEQKRDEELMAQTNRELRSINEDLDSFVYTASHDLKLPIINMAGIFKELTKSATFHDPDAELLIGMFDKALNQINATISDLAEIVKVQKNINAHRDEIELHDLLDEVTLSIKDMVKESQAQIYVDFKEVPQVIFSRVNLKSILYNLISNAIKYRSPERPPVVHLKTDRQGDFIRLTVQDNGLGIDLEKYGSKVFQMFKRFHNHVAGSGLGLYIINRIVQKNGGYIELQSEVGKGTTFQIYMKEASEPLGEE
ncbi:PAS domain-containing protein [Rufibacter quisquiliarum]|uniref:histidine kinase n=1 Tax=Rufibacter quisquiliarum TaxID=1549639 RepID=A0A839GU21_9BACT|nr:PAS domain-containing protein [Rufibacter quisquiliarum]MBA9078367.1 PAS domain S-box-containing protein [Rufibacter quisquiliarum]